MPLYTLRVCHRPIPGTLHLLSWGAVAGRQPYFIVLDLLVSLPSRLVTGRGWDAVMQLTPLPPHPHLRLAALGAPDVLVVTVVSSPTIRILLLAAPPPLSSPCVPCPRCLYLIYCLRRCWTPLHGSHLLLWDDPPPPTWFRLPWQCQIPEAHCTAALQCLTKFPSLLRQGKATILLLHGI